MRDLLDITSRSYFLVITENSTLGFGRKPFRYLFKLNEENDNMFFEAFILKMMEFEVRFHEHHPPQTPLVGLHYVCCCKIEIFVSLRIVEWFVLK